MIRAFLDDETQQRYVGAMGQDLGPVFCGLYAELLLVHTVWHEFSDLFTKPERVDLLNRAARWFFRVVQGTFSDSVLVAITRITDPERVGRRGGRDTLTIRRLPKLIPDRALSKDVKSLVKVACAKAEFARDPRNRRIAHNDLLLALGQGQPLQPVLLGNVRDALAAISAVLNRVESAYLQSETGFDHAAGGTGNAESLLYVIRDGLEADEARREEYRARRS